MSFFEGQERKGAKETVVFFSAIFGSPLINSLFPPLSLLSVSLSLSHPTLPAAELTQQPTLLQVCADGSAQRQERVSAGVVSLFV